MRVEPDQRRADQVVKEVTGREPRSVDEFVRDYKKQFLDRVSAA